MVSRNQVQPTCDSHESLIVLRGASQAGKTEGRLFRAALRHNSYAKRRTVLLSP